MAKITRKWMELDWNQTNQVLRAEDIPYSLTENIKEAIDRANLSVAVSGGDAGYLDEVLQAGDNVTFEIDGNRLVVSSQDKASEHEQITVTATDISNEFVTTTYDIIEDDLLTVSIVGGTTLEKNVDFEIDGNNVKWTGLELEEHIEEGDIINIVYTRLSSTPGTMTNFRKIKVDENYVASVGNELLVDSSDGPIEITLPASPMELDEVKIVDIMNTFNDNNVTVLRNGNKIKDEELDLILDVDGASISLIFYSVDYGWTFKNN